jgi:Na+-driven multidrug efflux pump
MGKILNILAIPYYYQRIKKVNTKKLFKEILESIAGTDKDFTSVSLAKAILLLSIPMVLEMIMESVFAVVDILFISRLGADAIATVGITESLMTVVYAIGFGFSIGTTALISRRIGEKRKDAAALVAVQSIFIGIAVSILIALPGISHL